MSHPPKHSQPVQKLVALLLGTAMLSGGLSVISPSRAVAKPLTAQALSKQALNKQAPENQEQPSAQQAPIQQRPTLRGLLETVLERPSSPKPDARPTEIPTESTADPVAEEETVSLLLRLSERRVYVYRDDSVEVSYPVAIGRDGWETPTGEFEVFHQLEDPGWTNPITGAEMPPGSDNPLGDRWIAFWTDGNNMIGFHGTPNRESVGQAASHGCIRMYNEDVRELYDIVSVGTPVMVVQ